MYKPLGPLLALFAFSLVSYSATPHKKATKPIGSNSSNRSSKHSSSPGQPSPERYRQIQEALAAKGYYTGEVNGHWGSDSVEALRQFQTDQSLHADGKLNSLSLIALGLGPKRSLSAQAGDQSKAATAPTSTTSQPGVRP